MTDGPFTPSATPTEQGLEAAHEAAAASRALVVALLDGALFDDLGAWFDHAGLQAEPLFRAEDDPEAALAGPWAVPLDHPAQDRALISMMGEARAPVVLCWHGDAAALVRHLRRTTLIEIPDETLWDMDGQTPMETVIFRFWDPAVLAAAWDVLTPEQQRRLFPGRTLALVDPWGTGAWRWLAASEAAGPPGQPRQHPFLRLSEAQAEAMDAALRVPYRAAMEKDTGDLLERAGLDRPTPGRLAAAVDDADWQAGELGLEHQDSVVALAFHILAFGPHSRTTQDLRAAIIDLDQGGTPDDRLLAHLARVVGGAGG